MPTLTLKKDAARLVRKRLYEPEPQRTPAERSSEYHSIAVRLGALYPQCFPPTMLHHAPIAPLKYQIHKDIRKQHPEIPYRALHCLLSNYTRSAGYQRLLVPGAVRIDLDGQPAGFVEKGKGAVAGALVLRSESQENGDG